MVDADRRPSAVLSRGSFLNAIVARRRHRRIDQRRRPPAGHRRSARDRPHARRLRRRRQPRPAPGRPPAVGPAPHGGLPSGRRAARRPARGPGPARSRGAAPSPGEPLVAYLADARIWDETVIRAAIGSAPGRRRHRRAARQPRPARRGHQAVGRVAASAPAPRARRGLRQHRGLPRPHRRPRPRRRCRQRPGPSRMRPEGATRACPRWRTCRSPPSCSRRGSGTWCGSAMAG